MRVRDAVLSVLSRRHWALTPDILVLVREKAGEPTINKHQISQALVTLAKAGLVESESLGYTLSKGRPKKYRRTKKQETT